MPAAKAGFLSGVFLHFRLCEIFWRSRRTQTGKEIDAEALWGEGGICCSTKKTQERLDLVI
jgi:hypothetical protein